jgi:endogenous inhibitor of DNA gyrase (YacG/DUF329 family)
MATLMIRCPIVGRPVSTGIAMDKHAFDRLPDQLNRGQLVCPACRQKHTWDKKDVLPFKD